MIENTTKFIDLSVGLKWDDMRAPASTINPIGPVAPPSVDTEDGGLLFGKGEAVAIWFQIPHGWKEGTALYPHLHWTKVSAGTGLPNWRYRYKIAAPGETFGAVSAWISGSEGLTNNDVVGKHAIWAFPPLDMTGRTLSTMLGIRLERTNDVNDTYSGDAKLLEFDIHYQIDAPGSKLPFEK